MAGRPRQPWPAEAYDNFGEDGSSTLVMNWQGSSINGRTFSEPEKARPLLTPKLLNLKLVNSFTCDRFIMNSKKGSQGDLTQIKLSCGLYCNNFEYSKAWSMGFGI